MRKMRKSQWPTAAEVMQAGVAWGQLDETVPIDRRELDDTEE